MSFRIRGYYVIPSRNQFWGLSEWKRYIDCAHEDDCNLIVLWIAGSFPSRKYPETWSYNRAHRNIQENFYPALIDYAHSKGIRVVLGFTPYAYDGVASYASKHPELAGRNPDGSIYKTQGIHDVAMMLCPNHSEARQFMLDYVREMVFDFHPNADGLFVESSDYGHCQCESCQTNYVKREWDFVQQISDEVWQTNSDATIVIYPLYFQSGVAEPNSRFTLQFTPHSAHITPDVLGINCDKLYWEGFSFSSINVVARGARVAYENDLDGYIVAMETFGYTQELNGRLVKYEPFDVPWSTAEFPMEDLVPRFLRFSYRFYSQNPNATEQDYRAAISRHFFGEENEKGAEDLVYVCSVLQEDFQHFGRRSSLVHPEDFDFQYPPDKRPEAYARYKDVLKKMEMIAEKHCSHELGHIARWIIDKWRAIHPELF